MHQWIACIMVTSSTIGDHFAYSQVNDDFKCTKQKSSRPQPCELSKPHCICMIWSWYTSQIDNYELEMASLFCELRLNEGYPIKVEITHLLDSLPTTWTTCKTVFVYKNHFTCDPGRLKAIQSHFNFLGDMTFSLKDTCYAWGKYSTSGYFGR